MRFAKLLTSLFFVIICTIATAQKVDFTIDKPSGCSPLTVNFTNASTGFTNPACKWEFGNGNTSTLYTSGTTYLEEKAYTVQLTLTENGKSYSQTKTVTVYKKPQVSFTPDKRKGCLPLDVTFTSNATAGDGTITNYFWDFGDGATLAGSQKETHTYTTPNNGVLASLTVTNSYGCYNSAVSKSEDIIKVLPTLKAAFTANQTVLCNVNDAATFTNTSVGPPTLTYTWDFGDGKQSADKTPTHIYGKKGVYTVKLTVNTSEGCTASSAESVTLNVANFTTDFTVPALVCEKNTYNLKSISNPAADAYYWLVDGANYWGYSQDFPYNPADYQPHTIQLATTFGNCPDTATKVITAKKSPELNGFIADLQGACGAPVTVKYKDTTKTAVKWEWQFGRYYYISDFQPTVFTQAPQQTYQQDDDYYAMLRVTDASGCSASVQQQIAIFKPDATINSSQGTFGCSGIKSQYTAGSNVELKTYKWTFSDDGTTSTIGAPEHTYLKEGNFTVTLNYTNVNGCSGTSTYPMNIYGTPKFDFASASGTTICGNTPVNFQVTGINIYGTRYWNFGDPDYYGYYNSNSHQYYYDSTYSVSLIIDNNGCRDTVTKTAYIKVLPPFPKISAAVNTCDDTRGLVTFTEASVKANEWSWDFGDGTAAYSYSTFKPEIKHTYAKTGTYNVVLTAKNGSCAVSDSKIVNVLLKQKPLLTASQKQFCSSDDFNTTISNLERNPWNNLNYYNGEYGYHFANYKDGSPFNGSVSDGDPDVFWQNPMHVNLRNIDAGKDSLRIITTSSFFYCEDTTNYISVKPRGPIAGFDLKENNKCFRSPVVFNDTSKGTNNIPIVKWEWDFGGAVETRSQGGITKHTYTYPGVFYPC